MLADRAKPFNLPSADPLGAGAALAGLASLGTEHSRILGQHFRKLADQLLARAEYDTRQAEQIQRRRERTRQNKQAAERALAMIQRGKDREEALTAVVGELELEQVAAWLVVFERKRSGRLRLRNVQIMRLVARGWTDGEIGRRYQMHRKSVNRIVRRLLRENPSSLPQPGAR